MSSRCNLSSSLSLSSANKIVFEALAEARRTKLAPLVVCVLDAGGQLVAFAREDGASLLREHIARGKAFGALGIGISTRAITENAAVRPAFWQSVFASGQVIASPGGVLILQDGKIVGAVGVSGDAPDEDESVAIHGISAAKLACSPAARVAKL